MAAYFFDIDGTIINYHTTEWIPGAKEMLNRLHSEGHDVIFITMRDAERDAGKPWSIENTNIMLAELDFIPIMLSNLQSPRIIIDDSKVTAIRRKQNKVWEDDEL
jgi:hypothetical protein